MGTKRAHAQSKHPTAAEIIVTAQPDFEKMSSYTITHDKVS